MEPYQIVLADDHALFREGIKRIIEGVPGLRIVGEAGDGFELLQILKQISPQLVILDISMPNHGGLEAIKEIRTIHPKLKVLILTMHKSRGYLYRAISLHVDGYLIKEDAHADLISAIKTIRSGGTHISRLIIQQIPEMFARSRLGEFVLPTETLTDREIQVLKLLAEGKTYKQIAELLFIGIRTVHSHRCNIAKKLNVKTLSALVKYAIKRGYTSIN